MTDPINMKNPVATGLILMIIILFTAGSCGPGGRTANHPRIKAGADAELLTDYIRDVRDFQDALVELTTVVEEHVPAAFEACRQSFKRIEFLLEYMDRDRHALFNGPPVAKENHASPGFSIIEPTGLQVLEEMICAGIPDPEEFESVAAELQFQATLWKDYLEGIAVDRRQWLEATLIHLVRIETLSLAGFDRPCTTIGPAILGEARISFDVIGHYAWPGSGSVIPIDKSLIRIDSLLADAATLDDIPLAAFIRNDIQPLRSAIIRQLSFVQHQYGWDNPPRPYNLNKTSLYDPDFIDASFFSAYGIDDPEEDKSARKIALGKKLFFEPLLSESGPMSCGTCHRPDLYFTDGIMLSSSNLPGSFLDRNTPTLIHAAYQSAYMYDARAASLEEQMLHVFRNEMEFNTHIDRVIDRLARNEEYRTVFDSLYPAMSPKSINLQSVSDALSVYVRSLTGHNSTFDRYMRGEIANLDKNVAEGFQLFMGKGKCGTCHFAPTFAGLVPPFFTNSELENIGTPAADSLGNWKVDTDLGRYRFFEHPTFMHFFKTSTVRNAEHTGPYMHNGVFDSLSAVLEFYNNGGGAGARLGYSSQTLPADSLGLSPPESEAIITFIRALTDSTYLNYQ